jgi:hypothetical protein
MAKGVRPLGRVLRLKRAGPRDQNCAPTEGPPARPDRWTEGTSANQIGTDVVWPKHGGPHRPRPAAIASCSAAAISSARAEGWP